MAECGYAQVGHPDSIKNTGRTEAIVDMDLVGLPFGYNQPSLLTMTDRGTIIAAYRTSGPRGGGEGAAGFMYCNRKPADSSWSEPIQIHADSSLAECPNIFHIPGTDTTLAWYYSDPYSDIEYSLQKRVLASGQSRVKVSTDDGVTWGEEIQLPAIDRDNHVISDTAYKWLSHNGHHWAYPQRNPFIMLPDGSLAGFAGIAGDYTGDWAWGHTRSMYLNIPRNNLFHTNPNGDAWGAVPVGTEDEWGNDHVGHNGDLLIFEPSATHVAMISRTNSLSYSHDGGQTWDWDEEGLYGYGDFANGDGTIGQSQGGAVSLDWWDSTSVLHGWHLRGGPSHPSGREFWNIWASNVPPDSLVKWHTWDNILSLTKNYTDELNGGIEDG
jgi:hypothetical protein